MAKKKNYFEGVSTLEELKTMYHTFVKMYHPDLNKEDTTKIMAEINKQYDATFKEVSNKHLKFDRQTNKYTTYTYDTGEVVNDFKDVINKVIHFKDCTIELIGSWLWVSGETKNHLEELKNLNFKFSGNKKAWSYHFGDYKKRSKTRYSIQDLRNKYGNVQFHEEEQLKLGV